MKRDKRITFRFNEQEHDFVSSFVDSYDGQYKSDGIIAAIRAFKGERSGAIDKASEVVLNNQKLTEELKRYKALATEIYSHPLVKEARENGIRIFNDDGEVVTRLASPIDIFNFWQRNFEKVD